MVKVQPIHEKLWGALNYVTSEVTMALTITRSRDTRLAEANNLLHEYASCFGANGKVSQRGEVPQCWNQETIFTPYREVGGMETLTEQLMLPFMKDIECSFFVKNIGISCEQEENDAKLV
tara:strand:+ start:99 stop:458 length:360 start_codon:yes stop_codon:yes gene_type:complete